MKSKILGLIACMLLGFFIIGGNNVKADVINVASTEQWNEAIKTEGNVQIRLINDIVIDEAKTKGDGNLSVDLNSHTIYVQAGVAFGVGYNANLELKNGTITAYPEKAPVAMISLENNEGKVNVSNVTFDGAKIAESMIYAHEFNGSAVFTNCKFTGRNPNSEWYGVGFDNGTANILLDKCTFNDDYPLADPWVDAYDLWIGAMFKVTVKDCTAGTIFMNQNEYSETHGPGYLHIIGGTCDRLHIENDYRYAHVEITDGTYNSIFLDVDEKLEPTTIFHGITTYKELLPDTFGHNNVLKFADQGLIDRDNNDGTFTICYPVDINKVNVKDIPDQAYTGGEIKPNVDLSVDGYKLKEGKDYEIVGYEKNVKVGTGYVIVKGKGFCFGTRKIPFKIVKPAAKSIIVAKAIAKGKNKMTIKWIKVKGANKYVVYGAMCNRHGKSVKSKKLATIKSGKKLKYVKKKLKKGIPYKFYVVAYKNNKKLAKSKVAHAIAGNYYKKYSNVKSIKVKKKKITIKKGKTAKIKAKIKTFKKKKSLTKGHASMFRYLSTKKSVAKVNKKGKVKGLKKGTCTVYVQAVNGMWVKVKVKVK